MADEWQIKGLPLVQRKYKNLEKKFPTLRRNTLNDMARDSKVNAKKLVGKKFINRNKFTVNSIRDRRATNSLTSVSKVGSLQKYMADQELGENSLEVGHIPTDKARTSGSNRKPVRRPNRMNKLGKATRRANGRVAVRKQIQAARIAGDRGPFKFTFPGKKGRVKGLFILPANRRKTIVMIQDLSKSHVKIKRKRWLEPSTLRTLKKGKKIFKKNLKFFV